MLAVLSLCSGVGGLDLGLSLAEPESRTVCYVEGEAYAASVLVARMEDETLDQAPVWSDVRTFDGRRWRGKVDCVTAGYPCQPFSVAGKRRGDKDPRHLWPRVRRIISQVRPGTVFLENVGGHLRLGGEKVLLDLHRLGYRTAAGMFTAEEVGAPHRRERWFCVASNRQLADARRQRVPGRDEMHAGGVGREAAEAEGPRGQWEWLRDALGDGEQPVGDASDAGRRRQSPGAGTGQRITAARSSGSREPVGDASSGGRWREADGEVASEQPHVAVLWPPGPGDTEAWSAVPGELKPAVRRVADGSACRVDRLRACGNGTTPLQAAYAYRTLKEALRCSMSG